MIDEVMRIVDNLAIPSSGIDNESLMLKKEVEDQNQRIDKLKERIKTLSSNGGSQKQLNLLQKQLDKGIQSMSRFYSGQIGA